MLSQGGLLEQSCGVDCSHGLPYGASDQSPPRGFATPCSARTRKGASAPHEKTRKIGCSFHSHARFSDKNADRLMSSHSNVRSVRAISCRPLGPLSCLAQGDNPKDEAEPLPWPGRMPRATRRRLGFKMRSICRLRKFSWSRVSAKHLRVSAQGASAPTKRERV